MLCQLSYRGSIFGCRARAARLATLADLSGANPIETGRQPATWLLEVLLQRARLGSRQLGGGRVAQPGFAQRGHLPDHAR